MDAMSERPTELPGYMPSTVPCISAPSGALPCAYLDGPTFPSTSSGHMAPTITTRWVWGYVLYLCAGMLAPSTRYGTSLWIVATIASLPARDRGRELENHVHHISRVLHTHRRPYSKVLYV